MRELARWNESVSVGNLDIDKRHRHLFRLWQVALDVLENEIFEKHKTREYLSDITEVMRRCFATEEILMADNSCPLKKQHAAEHIVFCKQLTEVISQTTCDADELHRVLQDWTSRHVPQMDVLCKDYFKPPNVTEALRVGNDRHRSFWVLPS